ncbi:peptidase, partial [Psychrobacter sp. Rd 27.2]
INDDQVLFRKWRDCGIDDTRGQNYSQLVALNPDYPPLDSRFTTFEVCGVATEHRIKLK